jgi:hypothetical protein
MTSIVSICNLALSNIGKDNIQALGDAGAEARACRQFYEHTRDLLLQSYPWRWAGKTQSMAEVTNDKPGAWAYAYARPNDCLKLRYVRPEYSDTDIVEIGGAKLDNFGIAHEVEGETIYTDISPAFLRYTYRVIDPSKFPPLFVEALAWHLAVRLAMPLTRDPSVRKEAFQIANGQQAVAQTADANEERDTSDIDSDLVAARG